MAIAQNVLKSTILTWFSKWEPAEAYRIFFCIRRHHFIMLKATKFNAIAAIECWINKLQLVHFGNRYIGQWLPIEIYVYIDTTSSD